MKEKKISMNIYKICLIKNRYTGVVDINKYVVDWFKTYANLGVVMDTISTDFDVTTFKADNLAYHGVICGADILPKIRTVIPENKYNAVVFVYGNDLDGIRVSSTNIMGADPLYPDTEFIQTWQVNDSGRTINHEMFHGFFAKAHKLQINIVDNMDTYFNDADLMVNGVIDTNREIALLKLSPYWSSICAFRSQTTQPPVQPMQTYKYFKPKEIVGLKPELVAILDKMRGECGFPFVITSGFRTVAYNSTLKDAVADSAHTTGEAVDIAITDSAKREIFDKVRIANGITRIGIASTFIHIDISKTLPQGVMWTYN